MPAEELRRGERTTHSQTLDRGIRTLEVLAEADQPLSIAELASTLRVHRSIIYRILRTLEDHRLVSRGANGAVELAVGLSTLARGVQRDLRSAALPELAAVAEDLEMTCFLVVPDGHECVTLASVEPRHSLAALVQHPGTRHVLDRGAPGLALLAGMPPRAGERADVARARENGYATTQNEVIAGLSAVAAPIKYHSGRSTAAISVVFVETRHVPDTLTGRLCRAAERIAAELG